MPRSSWGTIISPPPIFVPDPQVTEGQQISTDTVFKDENLVFTEDVEVTNGAKLTLKGCDVIFRPPGSTPLYLRVTHGTLEILVQSVGLG